MVKIGHARISELGTIDGAKGDQTKQEVCITNWYADKWVAVYRPKNIKQAEIIATMCEHACNNDNIGYSQYSRLSLFNLVCNNGYDIKGLKTPCNCDCSSLVMTCCRAANITVPKNMATYTMNNDLMKTNNFEKFTASKYVNDYKYLKRGDILLKQGHTAIVLTSGVEAVTDKKIIKAKYPAAKFDVKIAGSKELRGFYHMRNGAGKEYSSMCIVLPNKKVMNYGYYSIAKDGVKWLYCLYETNTTRYEGFISNKGLK